MDKAVGDTGGCRCVDDRKWTIGRRQLQGSVWRLARFFRWYYLFRFSLGRGAGQPPRLSHTPLSLSGKFHYVLRLLSRSSTTSVIGNCENVYSGFFEDIPQQQLLETLITYLGFFQDLPQHLLLETVKLFIEASLKIFHNVCYSKLVIFLYRLLWRVSTTPVIGKFNYLFRLL